MRILYIDIDSLRPDHLGCYGYHRKRVPKKMKVFFLSGISLARPSCLCHLAGQVK
jgi:hypothetical protein